ncbi:hypothetical protein FOPG_18268 [Fusarium oxysporum f. sp. conglutinans race 2 54008]|uniref:Uncharacterized protein n=1 Tax=Fusarium oxysporum f. sp. conglutinans race 2 54008 TaxID=1089457 RepID=X0GPG6_FUSOX|nr:hypothetical protein FOPG_18268 [Fusarium oxysporum f. sp. conglutinans race 2 54008]
MRPSRTTRPPKLLNLGTTTCVSDPPSITPTCPHSTARMSHS